jgi:TatD DNase family protein
MIVDTHCHLHDPAFADVRATVARAAISAVWGIIGVGCDPDTNERTVASAEKAPRSISAAIGFHPDWKHLTDEDLDRVEGQVAEHYGRIVALGEVGLPWYSLKDAPDATAAMRRGRERLDRLLSLAVRWDLPVVLHAPHDAALTAFKALQRHGVDRAVFHWHKASEDVTRRIIDAGYFVSVTPEVVYRERDRVLVGQVPLRSLLVESDGPWAYRGEFEGLASGPWLAVRVAEEVAKLKEIPVDDVLTELTANACRLFELPWV